MSILWAAAMTLALGTSVFADTDDDEKKKRPAPAPESRDELDRIQKLEREIEQLKASLPRTMSLDGQDKKEANPAEVEFRATFTDGFHIKTTDGNFDLHIGGRWLEEYRYTFNRPVNGGSLRTST